MCYSCKDIKNSSHKIITISSSSNDNDNTFTINNNTNSNNSSYNYNTNNDDSFYHNDTNTLTLTHVVNKDTFSDNNFIPTTPNDSAFINNIIHNKVKPLSKPHSHIKRDKNGTPLRCIQLYKHVPQIHYERVQKLKHDIYAQDAEEFKSFFTPKINHIRNAQLLKSKSTTVVNRLTDYSKQKTKSLLHKQTTTTLNALSKDINNETFTPHTNNKAFPGMKAKLIRDNNYLISKRTALSPLIQQEEQKVCDDLNKKYKSKLKTSKQQQQQQHITTLNTNYHKDKQHKLTQTHHAKYANYQNKVYNNTSYDNLYQQHELFLYKMDDKRKALQQQECPFKPQEHLSCRTIKLVKNISKDKIKERLYGRKPAMKEVVVVVKEDKRKKKGLKCKEENYMKYQREYTAMFANDLDKELIKMKDKEHNDEMCSNLEKKQQWLGRVNYIVVKTKIKNYKEIFNLLDKEKNGFISYDMLDEDNIDERIKWKVRKLVKYIKQERMEIVTFKEFCAIADEFLLEEMFKQNEDEDWEEEKNKSLSFE